MGAHRHNPTALAVAQGERITNALVSVAGAAPVHMHVWGMALEFGPASSESAKQEPPPVENGVSVEK